MTAQFTSSCHFSRCTAAACSCARIRPLLDTAILLVVSVCVLGQVLLLGTA